MNSKNNFYDESARVPLIIRYPNKIAAGKRIHVPVNLIDVRPTIEDYFNLAATKVDGKSLRPFIEDTYNKSETHFAVSEWYNDKIPGFMVRTATHKLMIAHTAEAKNTAIDGFYNLNTDSLEQSNILKLTTIPQTEKDKAQELKVLLVKWLKKVNSPYYHSVKSRPLGRMNANYTLYQNDIAKIKIPGITNLTGLPANASFKILTNDTIQITTTNNSVGLMGTTATISGGSTQVRFEVMPAIDFSTAIPQVTNSKNDNFNVSVDSNKLTVKITSDTFKNAKAQIYTLDGKLIAEKSFQSNSLYFNSSNITQGYYLIRINQLKKSFSQKVFIP
jgi:hypothetical protein